MQGSGFFRPALRVRSFWYGVSLPYQAARLILKTPVLLRLSLLPVSLAFVVYAVCWWEGRSWLAAELEHFFFGPAEVPGWVHWFLALVSHVFFFFLVALSFSTLVQFVTLPFCDRLSEAAEAYAWPPLKKRGVPSQEKWLQVLCLDAWKFFWTSLAQASLFCLHGVPLLNLVSIPLSFLLVTFQYISYAQTRRGLGLRMGLSFLKRHLFASLGFGLGTLFLLHLSWLSSLFIPLAVVGGTLLVARAQARITAFPLL